MGTAVVGTVPELQLTLGGPTTMTVDTERYATTFAMLDKDGDGRVSAVEFKELMGTLGVTFTDETAAKAIEMMDADGDGLVSLEELATYMSSPAAPQPRTS
ncbi:MAG TPA: EF-hand domain-containing protein [Acidimicrobiales bacterium]|nr:EF-hand domain-containing protein [Acidimicrobiales bacterium]